MIETGGGSPGRVESSFRWRGRFRGICVGSLVFLVWFGLTGQAFRAYYGGSRDSDWFKIANGLFALVELACFTLAGLGAIGWVLSPRRPKG